MHCKTNVLRGGNCPVCGSDKNIKYFYRDYRDYASIAPFLFYNVYGCKECGMAYAGALEESMPLDEYYEKMSRYEGDSYVLSPDMMAFYAREADFLVKYVKKDAFVLDIGCAFGGLLKELKDRGFIHLDGLEPSYKNVKYAKDTFKLDVYQGGLGVHSCLNRMYDVVILSEVLEHSVDLHKCAEELKAYLKPGGMLFIAVPDVDEFKKYADLYQEFSVEHINYFSIGALEKLFSLHDIGLLYHEVDEIPLGNLAGSSFSLWKVGKKEPTCCRVSSAIEGYLENCNKFATMVKKYLSKKDMRDGFYIWGAGTQTAMLYQLGAFPEEAVKGIVDSNCNYHGEVIYGHAICRTEILQEWSNRPILISAQSAQQAIKEQIYNMNLKNEVWTLI